jgi:hypothetical protein
MVWTQMLTTAVTMLSGRSSQKKRYFDSHTLGAESVVNDCYGLARVQMLEEAQRPQKTPVTVNR